MPNLNLTHSGNMNITSASITSAGTLDVQYEPNDTGIVGGWSFSPESYRTDYETGETLTVRCYPSFNGTVLTENFTVSGYDTAGVLRSDTSVLRQEFDSDLRHYLETDSGNLFTTVGCVINWTAATEGYLEVNITATGVTSPLFAFRINGSDKRAREFWYGYYETPGPDTGSVISSLEIVVADSITGTGQASAVYVSSSATVSLVYSSTDTSIATIDPRTGAITVLENGSVTFCVEDVLSGLEDCKTVTVYKDGEGPGPDTGDTGVVINELHIVVDDYVVTGDYASAVYSPVEAAVDLHYYSAIPSIIEIDETTGEITVLGTGVVDLCVVDTISGLVDCKSVNAATYGSIYVTYDVTSTTEPTQIMAYIDSEHTQGIESAWYGDTEIQLATGYTFPTLGEHTIEYRVKNIGPFYIEERLDTAMGLQTKYTWRGLNTIVKVAYDENMRFAGVCPFIECENLKYVTLCSHYPVKMSYYRSGINTFHYYLAEPWTLSVNPGQSPGEKAIPIVINAIYENNYNTKIANWYYDSRTGDYGDGYWAGMNGVIQNCYGWSAGTYFRLYPTTSAYLLSYFTDQVFIDSIDLTLPDVLTGVTETCQVSYTPSSGTMRGFTGETDYFMHCDGGTQHCYQYPPSVPFLNSDRLKTWFEYSSSNTSAATVDENGVIVIQDLENIMVTEICVSDKYTNISDCETVTVFADAAQYLAVTYIVTSTSDPTKIIYNVNGIQEAYYNGQLIDYSNGEYTFPATGEQIVYYMVETAAMTLEGRSYIGPSYCSFSLLGNIKKVRLPNTWEVLPQASAIGYFERCTNLEEVDCQYIKAMSCYTFAKTKVKTFNAPALEILGADALSGSSITHLTLPASLIKVSFNGAPLLRTITFEGTTAPGIYSSPYIDVYNLLSIWVPCQSVDAYKNIFPPIIKPLVRCLENTSTDVIRCTYTVTNTSTNNMTYVVNLLKGPIVSIKDENNEEFMLYKPYGWDGGGETAYYHFSASGDVSLNVVVDVDYVNANGLGQIFSTNSLYHSPSANGGLKEVVFPDSITNISNTRFGIGTLETVVLPSGATSIPTSAFSYCSNLKTVTLPQNLTTIPNYAFNECGITGITISNSVTSIGDHSFHGCSGFSETLVIPNSVRTIGEKAFYSAKGMSYIEIGSGITSIGASAFDTSYNILSVKINAVHPPSLGLGAFNYHNSDSTYPIYVNGTYFWLYKFKWGKVSYYLGRILPLTRISPNETKVIVCYEANNKVTGRTLCDSNYYSEARDKDGNVVSMSNCTIPAGDSWFYLTLRNPSTMGSVYKNPNNSSYPSVTVAYVPNTVTNIPDNEFKDSMRYVILGEGTASIGSTIIKTCHELWLTSETAPSVSSNSLNNKTDVKTFYPCGSNYSSLISTLGVTGQCYTV